MQRQLLRVLRREKDNLGTGGFGSVDVKLHHGILVAAKQINDDTDYKIERDMMLQLRHQNIIPYIAHDSASNVIYYELADYSLRQIINGKYHLSSLLVVDLILGCLSGLDYFHTLTGKIHFDIKPENLVVVGHGNPVQWTLKIIDFGIPQLPGINWMEGTADYLPIEAIELWDLPYKGAGINPAIGQDIDVYGAAVSFYELAKGVYPFEQVQPFGNWRQRIKNIRDFNPHRHRTAPHCQHIPQEVYLYYLFHIYIIIIYILHTDFEIHHFLNLRSEMKSWQG